MSVVFRKGAATSTVNAVAMKVSMFLVALGIAASTAGCGDDEDDANTDGGDATDTAGTDTDTATDGSTAGDATGGTTGDTGGTDAGTTGDTAGTGGSDTDTGTDTGPAFSYASCASPKDVLQFPTHLWLAADPAKSTGMKVVAPAKSADAAASLLSTAKSEWYQHIADGRGDLDGFPTNAQVFIAVTGLTAGAKATVDASKLAVLTSAGPLPVEIDTELSADGRTLMIRPRAPLWTDDDKGAVTLVFAPGFLTGGKLVPPCDGAEAADSYVTAAKAVLRAEPTRAIELALPYTLARGGMSIYAPRPVGEVAPSVESATLTDYSALLGDAPDSETAALLAPKAITGVLNLPKFQNDQGVVVMENGVLKEQGRTKPGFLLAWPKNVAPGASVPVVLYQHGGGGSPSGLLPHFKPYAEAGFAVIGIDLVCHGNRSCTPGGAGSDLDMVVVNELFRTRDNFRQTAADHEAVFTHLAALSDGIRALVPDAPSLDPERAFYVGFSMGAISGAGAAASTLPKGSALISGGGPFRTLIEQGVFTALVFAVFQGRPTVEKQLLYSMIQLSVDAADPATWLSRPTDPAGPVTLWVVKDDPVANVEAARVQAIAAGAVSARPATVPVTGLPEVDLPITAPSDGTAQFGVLISREYPDVSGAALHSAAHADPATHEIIVDGFNEIAFGRDFRVAAP